LTVPTAILSTAHSDIDDLSEMCKFHDCTHNSEPNCAIQQAICDGVLSIERLESYRKLKKETKYEGLNSKQIETRWVAQTLELILAHRQLGLVLLKR